MASYRVKASVLQGVKDLRLEDRQLPAPQPDQVQVAICSTGLCGSDLHYFNHYRNGDFLVREPLTLGHESSGIVTATGSAVATRGTLAVGDRVALEVGQPCETCSYCSGGRYNLCRKMRFRSSAKSFPHAQGTLQEKVNHPAKWCHKLPDAIPLELGALLEPLSVAMHAYARAGPLPPRPTVLVLGAGAVGLLAAGVAKAHAASHVVIADIQEERLGFALNHKFADKSFVVPMERPQNTDEKLSYASRVADQAKICSKERLTAAADGDEEETGEFDVVFECTGVETCLQTAIYSTKPGGKVMMIGMGTPVQTLPISAAALREVDLLGVFRYVDAYGKAIALLSDPPPSLPDLGTLVTHRFRGMDSVSEAFAMAGRSKDTEGRLVLKVMVDTASSR